MLRRKAVRNKALCWHSPVIHTERHRKEDEEIMVRLGHSEFEANLLKKKNGETMKDALNRSESANCGGLCLEPQVLRRQGRNLT